LQSGQVTWNAPSAGSEDLCSNVRGRDFPGEMKKFFGLVLLLVVALCGTAQSPKLNGGSTVASSKAAVSEASIRKHMQALASDEARGRGSATEDELAAGKYIATQLKGFGIEPAGDNGGFIQSVIFVPRQRNGQATTNPGEMHTSNVVGILRGTDPKLSKEAVLLSAHMDHLGIKSPAQGDAIYNGADDDASGVTAVLELARVLADGPRPKRTVIFALFGSEEIGGYGARYFLDHPPVPLSDMVANLEFEMIGRPDKTVAPHTLWLTGYERTNLGKELAAHGAKLVADPHPDQQFFRRSDNYALALRGVVAQTVSSYSLHPQYHMPDDDLAHIDFAHMTDSIGSMVKPVRWLVNSNFTPKWVEGMKPEAPRRGM
jgi:hypothetical protein